MKLEELLEATDYKEVTFSLKELTDAFEDFLRRLENNGNKRQDMIDYHIKKLVGVPYSQLVRKMPRGPRGRWADLMVDIRSDLKDRAMKKVK